MKIVVLAGGLSAERNVSLSSGLMVCRALRERGHQAAFVDMFYGLENFDGPAQELFTAPLPEDVKRVARQAPDLAAVRASRKYGGDGMFGMGVPDLCGRADVVFLALHGQCGEDGRVQAALELMGVPYTGTGYLGSAIAMDKDLTKRLLDGLVPMSGWFVETVTAENTERIVQQALPRLPLVVKPVDSGSSIGVSIVHDEAGLRRALAGSARLGGRTMLEEYIRGREIQVGILEGRALPSIEIVPKIGFYDYENKYQPGAAKEICPAPIPPQWEQRLGEAALTVFRTLGLSVYARADFIVAEDGTPWFLEINTLPGMTPTSLLPQEAAAVGVGYGELCERIIEASLKERGARRRA